MSETFTGTLDGAGMRIGIVVGRFDEIVTRSLLDGAREGLTRLGVDPDAVDVAWTPGSFEVPLVARRMAETHRYDAIISRLGAVIAVRPPTTSTSPGRPPPASPAPASIPRAADLRHPHHGDVGAGDRPGPVPRPATRAWTRRWRR